MKDGRIVTFGEETYGDVKRDTSSWRDPEHGRRSLIRYAAFFRENYRAIVRLADGE